jgi:hypothetical protein
MNQDYGVVIGEINKQIVVIPPILQAKTVEPTTSEQIITPDDGYNGLSQLTVEAVTSTIDSNIVSGNIRSGVSILGVIGSLIEGYLVSVSGETLTFERGGEVVGDELIL